jgi:SulP family sulfate permease
MHPAQVLKTIRSHSNLRPFAIIDSLRGYKPAMAKSDAGAGLNLALLAFPQGMAYAAIAGLPIEYGIYGSAVASILGPLVSGSRFIVLGPTNATSVLLFASFLSLGMLDPAAKAGSISMIVLLAGLFLILGAFLKVASLMQYISRSVVTGYITAAAIFIILNQTRKALGFDFALPEGSTFVTVLWLTIRNLGSTHWPSLVVAIITFLLYRLLARRTPRLPNVAICLFLLSIIGYAANQWLLPAMAAPALATLAPIFASEWQITLPPLRGDLMSQVATASLVIAFLSILEGNSIGKSLASRAGKKLDANQEMLGMGVANIGCALLQGMPASGSLTRSQLNYSSGAMSPLSSVFAGVFCIAGVFAFGPATRFIPVSALAVLVITIGLSLINRHVIGVVWKTTRSDRIVFLVTFLSALLIRLDFAIIAGTAISILLFLHKAAQPELAEFDPRDETTAPAKDNQAEISIVHVEGDLFFGAAELFRDQMRSMCERASLKVVILKLRYAHHMDATSILALEELVRFIKESGRHILITELRSDSLRVIRNSGLAEELGEENLFPDDLDNPTLANARALKRAMQLMGGKQADVRIYLGKSKKTAEDAIS